jgi:hypothetical protein
MHNMRAVLLGLAVMAASTTVATAQTGQVRKQRLAHARVAKQALVRNVTRGLFKGIQLSDAEKTRVKAVRDAYKPKVQELRKSLVDDRKVLRAIRQRGDTAGFRIKLRSTTESERARAKTLLEGMRTDLRGALTAENQAKFDANAARIKSRRPGV